MPWPKGKKRSAESKAKMSAAQNRPETLEKQRAAKRGEKNYLWKGNNASLRSARRRAERLYGMECPPGYQIHHIDGNPWNNERSNIDFVTPKQHMVEDGRYAALLERNATTPRDPVTGRFVKGREKLG